MAKSPKNPGKSRELPADAGAGAGAAETWPATGGSFLRDPATGALTPNPADDAAAAEEEKNDD